MKLSAKGRTAVTAVADLATVGQGSRVRLTQISERQGLSQSFLEQVFVDLRRAGLVDSKRGPTGGYALTRQPDHITVSEVIAAVEEEIRAHGCRPELAIGCTGRSAKCLSHSLWGALEDHIGSFLDAITIQMVVDGHLQVAPAGIANVYLDHNATSPASPKVISAVSDAMGLAGNASAQHAHGRSVARLVSNAREAVGMAMGQCAQDVIFTGSGTEAINTAVHSAVASGCSHLIVSSLDHPASIMAAEASGAKVTLLPATASGQTDMDALQALLSHWDDADGRPFLSLVAANSETGVVQDTDRAIDLIHDAGGLVLIDAVQALGKLPMLYPADYVAVSAHKIGGPQGVGALYVSPDAPFTSLLNGGGQERRRRAGTLNVPGIAGFGAAVALMNEIFADLESLRDTLEARLLDIDPTTVIFGDDEARLPNTLFFSAPGLRAMTAMMAFDLAGISVSTGTACSSGKVGESRALRAMGRIEAVPDGAIRVSFGPGNTMNDVEIFAEAWAKLRQARKAA